MLTLTFNTATKVVVIKDNTKYSDLYTVSEVSTVKPNPMGFYEVYVKEGEHTIPKYRVPISTTIVVLSTTP